MPRWPVINKAAIDHLLSRLDDEQRAAANAGPGLYALIGNPGSGKTTTIVARIARLVRDGLDPRYILAMTFTRNAAGEMNDRLASLGIESARVGTIHSVCRQVLSEGNVIGGLRLIEGECAALFQLKDLIGQLRKKEKLTKGRKAREIDVEAVQAFIGECKATGICYVHGDPFGYNQRAVHRQGKIATKWWPTAKCTPEDLMTIYTELEKHRGGKLQYDFDDMLLWAWMSLVKDRGGRRIWWRRRWSVVIVDECQDSNRIQWDIARFLVGLEPCTEGTAEISGAPTLDDDEHNLMTGGDPSQSVFAWRHADPSAYLEFAARDGVEKLVLANNYRSKGLICRAGSGLVRGKEWHLGGDMRPARSDAEQTEENPVELRGYPSGSIEAEDVVKTCIAYGQKEGLRSCAVLSRLSISLCLAEIECIRARIPYIKRASGSFLESKEVLDLMAYLRVAVGADPQGQWLDRVIRTPFRFISRAAITKAAKEAQRLIQVGVQVTAKDWPTLVLNSLKEDEDLNFKQVSAVAELITIMRELRDGLDASPPLSPGELLAHVLERTDYMERTKQDVEFLAPDESRQAIIGELLKIGTCFVDTAQFIAYIDQLAAAIAEGQKRYRQKETSTQDYLVLSTIHRAKGLEWGHVFVTDVVQGVFPCSMSDNIDEELRLFYVALTRSKVTCRVSYTKGPDDPESPSFTRSLRGVLKALGERITDIENDEGNSGRTAQSA